MDNVMLLATTTGILLVMGAFAGVLAGLLGVGGGIILVPTFFYVFSALGYDSPQLMQICLATSLATIIVTSVRSVMSHHKKGAVEWDILKTWGLGIVIGAAVMVAARTALYDQVEDQLRTRSGPLMRSLGGGRFDPGLDLGLAVRPVRARIDHLARRPFRR